MIGSGLKKLAAEYNMRVAHGVAYGDLRGYACTLCEGSGWKRIVVATQFQDFSQRGALEAELKQTGMSREYRVQNLTFFDRGIDITFSDTIGTLNKMRAFIDWFFPLLDRYCADRSYVCAQCGETLSGNGGWKLVHGIAYPMHHACADQVRGELGQEMEERRLNDKGSYVSGFFGALIGALIGAVVWGLVLNFGFVASIIGFVIGWLAEKGYQLCKGKQGKGKVAILVIVTIIGVLVGTFGADVVTIVQMMNAGELPGLTVAQIPLLIVVMLTDSEYLMATLANLGLGLVFAFLGIWSILKRTKHEVSVPKVEDLD